MSLEKTEKQPYESYFIHGNFEEVMKEGETISQYTVTAVDVDGVDATSTLIENGSETVGTGEDIHKLFARIQGGLEAKSKYKVTFRIVTNTGNKWEVDAEVKIKET